MTDRPRPTPAPRVRQSFRFPAATLAKIEALAARWGEGRPPVTNTAVIVEAVDRVHATEFGRKAE
jgi:hypothetical protein